MTSPHCGFSNRHWRGEAAHSLLIGTGQWCFRQHLNMQHPDSARKRQEKLQVLLAWGHSCRRFFWHRVWLGTNWRSHSSTVRSSLFLVLLVSSCFFRFGTRVVRWWGKLGSGWLLLVLSASPCFPFDEVSNCLARADTGVLKSHTLATAACSKEEEMEEGVNTLRSPGECQRVWQPNSPFS